MPKSAVQKILGNDGYEASGDGPNQKEQTFFASDSIATIKY